MPDYELETIRGKDYWQADRNWLRLGQTVFYDMVHVTALYDELNHRQRKSLDRSNEFALHPDTHPTPKEIRRAKHNFHDGIPLHKLPLIMAAAGAALIMEAAVKLGEKYAESNMPGGNFTRQRLEGFDKWLTKSELLSTNNDGSDVLYSSLRPQLRIGHHALRNVTFEGPIDYILDVDQFIATSNEVFAADGTQERIDEYGIFKDFNAIAPKPMSAQERLERASTVFMSSPLLTSGEIFLVGSKHRVDYSHDGPTTLHLQVTNPYGPVDQEFYSAQKQDAEDPDFLAKRVLSPNPFDELLASSRR